MEFADRLFNLIHGLPVEEPKYSLGSGPSEPGAFQKFHEKLVFDHMMGKTSAPAGEEIPVLEKLLQPRDSRDETSVLAKLFNIPGERITRRSGGDLAKRFPDNDGDARKVARIEREHFSSGDVIAEFDENNHVTRTYFEPSS